MPSSAEDKKRWRALATSEIFKLLGTTERGLAPEEARKRLGQWGANRLPEAKTESLAAIFIRQFRSPLIYLLLAASLVVFYLGEYNDGFIILFVLLFNAVVGTIQEGRSQNTLTALRKFTETTATVLRGGREVILPDADLVPGDVVILQEGEKVPADARVIAAANLRLDEAALTGESEPVHKVVTLPPALRVKTDLSPAEQRNMVFKGTYILSGNGKAVVTTTGLKTEIGRISQLVSAIDTEIPLRADVRHLSRLIIFTVGTIALALFAVGLALEKTFTEMFTTVVSLSVSIIPEGLPVVLSVVLAIGVWRMSKRNALVKRLAAVEALGQARVIAVDKTGTITKNEMVIQRIYINGKFFEISGVGYEPKGEAFAVTKSGVRRPISPLDSPEVALAARVGAFSANARLSYAEDSKEWRISGDPTEAATLVLAEKMGLTRSDIERNHPLVEELPFDYRAKFRAAVRQVNGRNFLSVVGAPEKVLELCGAVWEGGGSAPFQPELRTRTEAVFQQMSAEGLRVLAFAVNDDAPAGLNPSAMPPLTFAGFYAMRDALRPEVKESVARAKAAGVKVVMITGDHRLTAETIAREAGILDEEQALLTGEDIERLSGEDLAREVAKTAVFARVTPEHKLKIIQAYKERGEIVAMTGDGVNDAPSLVAADLGVAMGKIGTEVAKEAADIVILDDNFSSIVAAIEEGRSIYKTIQKVILYLFSTSVGEVLTIAGALFLGYSLPILPAQILWLNLVTDGFLDVALAMEPKESGLLDRKFERPRKYLVSPLMAQRMFIMALPMMVGTLWLFKGYIGADLARGWTVSLTVLAVFQWFNVWNCRSEDKSVFQMNPFSNMFLVGATIIIVLLQLAAVYTAPMQKILRTVPLAASEWLWIVPVAFSIVAVEEARKFIYRRKRSRSQPVLHP